MDRVCDRHFYINLTIRDKTRGTADRQSSALGWNRIDRLNLRGTSGLRRGTGKWDGGAGSKKGYDFWTEAFGRDLKGWGGGGELRKRTSKRHCSAAGAEGICRGPAVWLTSLTNWIIFFVSEDHLDALCLLYFAQHSTCFLACTYTVFSFFFCQSYTKLKCVSRWPVYWGQMQSSSCGAGQHSAFISGALQPCRCSLLEICNS